MGWGDSWNGMLNAGNASGKVKKQLPQASCTDYFLGSFPESRTTTGGELPVGEPYIPGM